MTAPPATTTTSRGTSRAVATPRIPVFRPLLGDEEIAAAVEALEMGWLGMGSYVAEFEAALAERIGATDRHVVAVSTGHAAIHLALLLAGVGPGDEVITPSFNNIADFQAILATGAAPVFCDVLDRTLCIDPDQARAMVGPRTKAIIAMDYACTTCDHEAIADLAGGHDLRVIHDAAHSIGSTHNGRPVGSFSDICVFSFDPVKTITTIDGGAIVLAGEPEAEAAREMCLIGMGQPSSVLYRNERAWTYDVKRLGFRYHMANLHARIGLAQLEKFDEIASSRRAACRFLNDALAPVADVRTPPAGAATGAPFLYYIRVPSGRRDDLRRHLDERGIDTGIHWQPGHSFSLLQDCRRGELPVTDRAGGEILTLPLHSNMEQGTLERIAGAVASFFCARGAGPAGSGPP